MLKQSMNFQVQGYISQFRITFAFVMPSSYNHSSTAIFQILSTSLFVSELVGYFFYFWVKHLHWLDSLQKMNYTFSVPGKYFKLQRQDSVMLHITEHTGDDIFPKTLTLVASYYWNISINTIFEAVISINHLSTVN